MRQLILALALGAAVSPPAGTTPRPETPPAGVRLESLAAPEATTVLQPDAIVVIPLGEGAKEHGPHLKMRTDLTLAEYVTSRVVETAKVVAAPPLTYHYEPTFAKSRGSTSLSLNAARDLTADVVRSLARSGPRRFYVVNMGTSTGRALAAAAGMLSAEGILLRYTDLESRLRQASFNIADQGGRGHADDIETSMMLYVEPASVDMKRAVRGANGDSTLATREKGRAIVESLVSSVIQDIDALRGAALPAVVPAVGQPLPGGPATGGVPGSSGCTPGDERTIRGIGDAFAYHWMNGDAIGLGGLWTTEGDIVHPDGMIERGSRAIIQNRAQLFAQRQYRGTRHPLYVGNVRCLSADVAIADGKWELRGVTDSEGQPVPTLEGLCTLVVRKSENWQIEAYRYTIKPASGNVPPPVLQRPGWPVIK